MNDSRRDVLDQKQKLIKRKIYDNEQNIGIIDIGKKRKTQEDSLLIAGHPIFKNLELLLVADGMGGLSYGEIVSNLVAVEVLKWFENISSKNIEFLNLIREYNIYLHKIDTLIRNKLNGGGSTLVSAIIAPDKTLITSVGDSRCYALNENRLFQINKDHNEAWELFEKHIIEKDDLRFCKNNNLLTSRLGGEKRKLKIDSFILENNKYEKLLLCSDGVTDILSDRAIKNVLLMENKLQGIKKLVDYSLNSIEYKNNVNDKYFNDCLYGGKDNISAIIRKRKR